MPDFFDMQANVTLPKVRQAFQENCKNTLSKLAGKNNPHKMHQLYSVQIGKIFNALINSAQEKIQVQLDEWNPNIFTPENTLLLKRALEKSIQVQIFIRKNPANKSDIKDLNKIKPCTVLTSTNAFEKNFISTEKKVWVDLGDFSYTLSHDPFLASYIEKNIQKNLQNLSIKRNFIARQKNNER